MIKWYPRWQGQVNEIFDEIFVSIQVIIYPAYAQYKLRNVYNVGGFIDHDIEKISTTDFCCNFPQNL